jgi:hypothetical protein
VNFQTIGSYLDVLLFQVLGALAVYIPHKLVGTSGTDEERWKKLKVVKISGVVVLVAAIGRIILKLV